jgi:hypothetical protein
MMDDGGLALGAHESAKSRERERVGLRDASMSEDAQMEDNAPARFAACVANTEVGRTRHPCSFSVRLRSILAALVTRLEPNPGREFE